MTHLRLLLRTPFALVRRYAGRHGAEGEKGSLSAMMAEGRNPILRGRLNERVSLRADATTGGAAPFFGQAPRIPAEHIPSGSPLASPAPRRSMPRWTRT
eukprot:scaffold1377_cov390-Prasinococcus_capsulatus_cf.AAC.8